MDTDFYPKFPNLEDNGPGRSYFLRTILSEQRTILSEF